MIAYTLQSLHGINKRLTTYVCKTLCPYSVFLVTYVLYNWISQFKISCTIVWRRNSFSNCYLIFLGRFDPSELDLWPSNPKMNSVPLLPRMDVWTKFEEGRSRHSRVIEWKRFWHIWAGWPWPLTQWLQYR